MNLNIEQMMHISADQVQKQDQMTSMDKIMAWRLDPMQFMREKHPVFSAMTVKSGNGRRVDFGNIWKKIRDEQILTPDLHTIFINILGPNGSAKGILGQAFTELILQDHSMHLGAKDLGFRVIPMVDLFATTIKSLQLPGTDPKWAIPQNIEHGGFSAEHYQTADDYSLAFRSQISYAHRPDRKLVFITERPSPTAYPIDRANPPAVVGINRALRSVYGDAFNSDTNQYTNFFIMNREPQVRELAASDRDSFKDSQLGLNPFTGHMQYWLPFEGVKRDVATLSPTIQKEVLDLLRLGTAPRLAIERGDTEMYQCIDDLYKANKLKNPSIPDYLNYLRKSLISRRSQEIGIPSSRVYLVENLALTGSRRPEYHLDNLTIYNIAVTLHPELVGPNLRKFVLNK